MSSASDALVIAFSFFTINKIGFAQQLNFFLLIVKPLVSFKKNPLSSHDTFIVVLT